MVTGKREGSARERLLEAANELFYDEGVHTVGIDRVLERAGVAKASLYSTFGSKDELVRVYLENRALARRERVMRHIGQHAEPRDRILAIFGLLEETASEPTFRGCAFVNACAERTRESNPAHAVSLAQREWMCALFTDLAREVGVRDPARVGRQLKILYDGAIVGAAMASNPSLARDARAMAESLLDAEGAKPVKKTGTRPAPGRRRARP
jgi:AcrR family transcriptional regulator